MVRPVGQDGEEADDEGDDFVRLRSVAPCLTSFCLLYPANCPRTCCRRRRDKSLEAVFDRVSRGVGLSCACPSAIRHSHASLGRYRLRALCVSFTKRRKQDAGSRSDRRPHRVGVTTAADSPPAGTSLSHRQVLRRAADHRRRPWRTQQHLLRCHGLPPECEPSGRQLGANSHTEEGRKCTQMRTTRWR
jgi:hypothetical protein